MTITADFDTAAEDFEDNFMMPQQRATLEASVCGLGCESHANCPHAEGVENWEQEEDERGAWLESTYNSDFPRGWDFV